MSRIVRKRLIVPGLVFLAAFSIAWDGACAQENKQGSIPQELVSSGTRWKLIQIEGSKVSENRRGEDLVLDKGRSSEGGLEGGFLASDRCIDAKGSYRMEGNSIRVVVNGSFYAVACLVPLDPSDPQGAQVKPAPSFAEVLRAASTYNLHGSQLWLRGKSGVVIAKLERQL